MQNDLRKQQALEYHSKGRPGKIEVIPTKEAKTQRDLSLAYSPGVAEPCKEIAANPDDIYKYTAKGNLVAYVGDVVGTGSSRKSATNSVLWFTGEDIPFVPNKRFGGVCLGGKIAPIFYNTMEDAGALPIELDVSKMEMGDLVELRPYEGKALKNGEVIAEFKVKSDVLFDEVRAGGRIPLIVGRGLTAKAREARQEKQRLADEAKAEAKRQKEKAVPVKRTEAEQKVARDARYAARKARK